MKKDLAMLTRYLVKRRNAKEGQTTKTLDEERKAAHFVSEWALVLETGWTLDYIRSLSPEDFRYCLSTMKTISALAKTPVKDKK